MTAVLHERLRDVPRAVLPARAIVCSGCSRDRVRDLPLGIRGFCTACLERSRSAVVDGELGGEC